MDFIAASKSQSRVFVAEGLPGPDNPPKFYGCLVMGGASQGLGDVEYIYCPDPENYNRFVPVGEILGKEENVETSISGHFPLNSLSQIIKWGRAKTPLAIHVHFGTATNPQNFNVFQKAVVFDNRARITSTDIEEMGGLDESGQIGQSADISAADYYEVVGMSYGSIQSTMFTGGVGSGVAMTRIYNDALPIDERFGFFAASQGATAVKPALVYSVNGGKNWAKLEVPTAAAASLKAVDVIVINDQPVLVMAVADLFSADVIKGATALTSVAFTHPNKLTCAASTGETGYLGEEKGKVYKMDSASSVPKEITVGVAAADDVTAIHALEGGIVIIGDSKGNVFFSKDGDNFAQSVPSGSAVVANAITAVCAIDEKILWVGDKAGNLWYSIDGGSVWKMRGFPGSGAGSVTGITFPMLSVGFVAYQPTTGQAKIFKTVGAGADGTFYEVPRSTTLPAGNTLKVASVHGEPNRLLAAGVAGATASGANGMLVYGSGV
jgi:hypothetical protein